MTGFQFPPKLPAPAACDVVGLGANASDHLLTIPRHPLAGEKLRFTSYRIEGGGQAATAMVAVARLGFRARYVGGIGDDLEGERTLAGLRAEGIDITHVLVRCGGASQRAVILVNEANGERTILWGRSESMVVGAIELTREMITAGRILHTDAQDPHAAARAARWAKEAGMPVLADLEAVRPGLAEFLPHADVLITDAEFPRLATGAERLDDALRILEERAAGALVMTTLGVGGMVARIGGELCRYPSYEVEAVDTTGAGDVLHGAFAVACLRGLSLEEAIDFSQAVAAMKCRAMGGRPGIPSSLEEVDRFRRATPQRRRK